MPIFQSIPVLNGLGNSIALSKNPKKAVFLKFLLNVSFTNESDKKRIFKSLTLSSLTLCARGVAVKSTGGFRGYGSFPCTHVGTACKKQPCFEEN